MLAHKTNLELHLLFKLIGLPQQLDLWVRIVQACKAATTLLYEPTCVCTKPFETVRSTSISIWLRVAAGTLKVFWIKGDTFSDFDIANVQDFAAADGYLRVIEKQGTCCR